MSRLNRRLIALETAPQAGAVRIIWRELRETDQPFEIAGGKMTMRELREVMAAVDGESRGLPLRSVGHG